MKILLHLTLLLALFVSACSRYSAVGDKLDVVDALINAELPDSALAMLDSIDLTGADDALRARHALLTSKAGVMALPFKKVNDSTLSLAADFYKGHGDSLELHSSYLFGRYFQRDRHTENIDHNNRELALRRVLELAGKLHDTLYLAKAHYAMAGSPVATRQQRADHYLQAGRYYRSIGKIGDAVSCISTAARNLNSVGKDSAAVALLLEIKNDADTISSIIPLTEYNMAISAIKLHYITQAEINQTVTQANSRPRPKTKPLLQPNDSTKIYIRGTGKGNEFLPTAAINDSLLNIIVERMSWPSDCFKYSNTHEARANFLSNPYTRLLDQHYRSIIDEQRLVEQQSQLRAKLFIALTALLVLIVLIIYLVYSRRLRDKKLQLLSLVSDIDNIRIELSALQSRLAEQRDSATLMHPYRLIDSLCEIKQNVPSTSDSERVLGKNVSRFIDRLNSAEVTEEIETFVNTCRSDIMVRFRKQFPTLTPRQYHCVLLIFAGFSANSISSMLHYPSDGACRTERSRLKRMISQSGAPDAEFFLSYFG